MPQEFFAPDTTGVHSPGNTDVFKLTFDVSGTVEGETFSYTETSAFSNLFCSDSSCADFGFVLNGGGSVGFGADSYSYTVTDLTVQTAKSDSPIGGEIAALFGDTTITLVFGKYLPQHYEWSDVIIEDSTGTYCFVYDAAADTLTEYDCAAGPTGATGGSTADLHIQLTWDTANTEVDLHLLRLNDSMTEWGLGNDCYWSNCATERLFDLDGNLTIGPEDSLDWGVAGVGTDNPFIDVSDNLGGFGPENMFLNSPEVSTAYGLYVDYWGTLDLTDPLPDITPSVRIGINGTYTDFTPSQPLTFPSGSFNYGFDGDFWHVADIVVDAGGNVTLTPVDTISAGSAHGKPVVLKSKPGRARR